MRNILSYFKFNSIKLENQLNKFPIFCFDFLQGIAMLYMMVNVLILISIFKPLSIYHSTSYSFIFLTPFLLFIGNIIYSVYGDFISRNIVGWSIPLLIIFGIMALLIGLTPSPYYFNKQNEFNYLFNNSIITSLSISLLIFMVQSIQNTIILLIYSKAIKRKSIIIYKSLSFILINIITSIFFIIFYHLLTHINNKIIIPNIIYSVLIESFFSLFFLIIINPVISWLRKKEGIEVENINFKKYRYNWFKFFLPKDINKLTIISNNKIYRPTFRFNYLCGLAMAYMMFMLISGTTVFKLIQIYKSTIPAAVLFVPFIYSFSNIMTEIYGYAIPRNMLWWYIFVSLTFTLLGIVIAYYPSPEIFNFDNIYKLILGSMPRVFLAGTLGTICGISINNIIVSKLKKKLNGYHYWLRSIVSTAGGELVYNVIAYPIMFIGKVTSYHFLDILISVSIFKLSMTACVWPFECFVAKKLKFIERANVYDYDVNYSIFHLSIKNHLLKVIK